MMLMSCLLGRVMQQKQLGPVIADIKGVELDQCEKEFLQHPQLGGLIFFTRNYEDKQQLTELVRSIRALRPELILSVDQEGGRVQRFKQDFTRLPPMSVLGALFAEDSNRAETYANNLGQLMAYELRQCDIDISYAPVLDLDDDRSRVVGDRSFSPCVDTCTALTAAFVEGMRLMGMCATAKHFPGHGGVVEDSHLELPVDSRYFEEIWQRDMQPFRCLQERYDAVMTAHIVFSDVDDKPVSFSRVWIDDILRKKMGFDGIVFSDDLSMKGAANVGSVPLRAECALASGCDAVLICNAPEDASLAVEYLEQKQPGVYSRLALMRGQKMAEEAEATTIAALQDVALELNQYL